MKRFIVFIILFVSTSPFYSQQLNTDELDAFINEAVKVTKAPGFAVGIIKDSTVIFKKGYGTLNTSTGTAVNTASEFGIASCTKAFTAAAIGLLVDEGKINWDDRVVDLLPYFQLNDPYVTSEMRVQDLLCHRSGLGTFDGDLLWYGSDYSRKDVVTRIKNLPLKHGLREQFGYSNLMYLAAGQLIEEVSGMSWNNFISEHFFKPLEMKSSTTTNKGFETKENVAFPHLEGKPIDFLNYDNFGAAASINSNIDDLLIWTQMWLNKGKHGDKQILSEKIVEKLLRSHTIVSSPRNMEKFGTHFSTYALGWFLSDYNGRMVIRHDGGLPGFLSRVLFMPEENLGIVILTNDMTGINGLVSNKIIDMVTEKENENSLNRYAEFMEQREKKQKEEKETRLNSRIPDTNPSLDLAEYAGNFEDKMYGPAKITFNDGKLSFEMCASKKLFEGPLTHWHYDTFRFDHKDPFLTYGLLTFELDKEGKVTGFTIDLPNGDFHFFNLHFVKK